LLQAMMKLPADWFEWLASVGLVLCALMLVRQGWRIWILAPTRIGRRPSHERNVANRYTCERCGQSHLRNANFCGGCGLMLKSHNDVKLWMIAQRDMVERQRSLSESAGKYGDCI
jgi:hypothetical protein